MKNGQKSSNLIINNLKNYSNFRSPEKAIFDLMKFNVMIVSLQFQLGTKLILKLEFLEK